MDAILQNIGSSITGNLPKAILFVRDINSVKTNTPSSASQLGLTLLNAAASSTATQTLKSLTGAGGLTGLDGFLGLEVQYNPSSIYLETVAGRQVKYSGGGLGSASDNQITQITQPVSTTMSFQLVFDDMNPSDAFMVNSFSVTGDLVSKVGNLVKKASGEEYSVKKQMDGLMSLLTCDATRQVVFFWAQMSFRGEVINVNSRYTMFSPSGNPIRGVVELTIRQGSASDKTPYDYEYEEEYWNKAFDSVFNSDGVAGLTSTFQKVTQNNFLNLNI